MMPLSLSLCLSSRVACGPMCQRHTVAVQVRRASDCEFSFKVSSWFITNEIRELKFFLPFGDFGMKCWTQSGFADGAGPGPICQWRVPRAEDDLFLRFLPCATMSTLTCYRTSRSFHFPFWAVCSLSGTQPEFSFGRLQPHVEKDKPCCFLLPFNPRPSSSAPPEGEGAPGSSGPVHLGRSGPAS
jgi:hypothetical protein